MKWFQSESNGSFCEVFVEAVEVVNDKWIPTHVTRLFGTDRHGELQLNEMKMLSISNQIDQRELTCLVPEKTAFFEARQQANFKTFASESLIGPSDLASLRDETLAKGAMRLLDRSDNDGLLQGIENEKGSVSTFWLQVIVNLLLVILIGLAALKIQSRQFKKG